MTNDKVYLRRKIKQTKKRIDMLKLKLKDLEKDLKKRHIEEADCIKKLRKNRKTKQ